MLDIGNHSSSMIVSHVDHSIISSLGTHDC